jgi:hypothetical protein
MTETRTEHLKHCRYTCQRRVVCRICRVSFGMACDLKENGACHYFKCQAAVAAEGAAR